MTSKYKDAFIGKDSIDGYLWDVQRKCMDTIGCDKGENAMYPLAYYIHTGRASVEFLHKLFAVHPHRIARILMGGGSDQYKIERVKKAIRF